MLDLLNLKEAAAMLKVSIHTVRSWTYQRKFPVVRLGRRVLVRRKDMEDFVEKNLIQAREERD